MAKTYITEYADFRGHGLPFGAPSAVQTAITNSGTSQQSAAFNDVTNYIRLHSDGIISYLVGVSPTALISNTMRLPAGETIDMMVNPGDKIAIITTT
jgi:hypothetical protein